MVDVLILCTSWEKDYWEKDKKAPYPKTSIKPIRDLKNKVPIPAIGVYIKGKERDYTDRAPCFIVVKDISENEKEEPSFDFHFISRMEGLTSAQFLSKIRNKNGLFFTVSEEQILKVLQNFNIQLPVEWLNLLKEKKPPAYSWLDRIGKYYQEILQITSNNEYEDRIAEIFTALGFEVEQLGYKKEGEYPDGIAFTKDFAIIYECKNRSNYSLSAGDKRAIIKYIQYAKPRIEERRKIEKVYFAIIANSYNKIENISEIEKETYTKGFLLTSESILYLLFKKLSLGPSFLLTDFPELISNKVITKEDIEKVYKRSGVI